MSQFPHRKGTVPAQNFMLATHRQGEGLVDVDDRANGTVPAQKRDSSRTKKGHIVRFKRNIWGNRLPHIYATKKLLRCAHNFCSI